MSLRRIDFGYFRKIPCGIRYPAMGQRRIYPSWLPPTAEQRKGLLRIRRSQTVAMLWMVAFIPAGWVVMLLARSSVMLVPLTILWISVGVALARHITEFPCPRCGAAFCVKTGMPYMYALFNGRCEACGLSLHSRLQDVQGS
jgi:predicted RNA-binding Zn-ribbon protein involved in translation (DUF1610 family)